MDIEQVRREKRALGNNIRDLLIEFSNKTNIGVKDIRFAMFDESQTDGRCEFSCTSIGIDLEEI
jgi:hypothetical protein